MKKGKRKVSLMSASVLLLILGVVLAIWPEFSMNVIVYGLSAIVTLVGIGKILYYVLNRTQREFLQGELVAGIFACLAGILIIPQLLLWASIVPIFIGIVIIASGISKIMSALEWKRNHLRHWWIMLVMALLSFGLGGMIIMNPFSTLTLTVRVIGIVLILDNAGNVYGTLMFRYRLKKDGYVVVDSGDDNIIDIIQ